MEVGKIDFCWEKAKGSIWVVGKRFQKAGGSNERLQMGGRKKGSKISRRKISK